MSDHDKPKCISKVTNKLQCKQPKSHFVFLFGINYVKKPKIIHTVD